MRRKFICTPEDIASFTKAIELGYALRAEACRSDFKPVISMRTYLKEQLDKFIKKECKAFQFQADDVTAAAIDKMMDTGEPAELHYALHHIIYQLIELHNERKILIYPERLEQYKKATEDCIEEKYG